MRSAEAKTNAVAARLRRVLRALALLAKAVREQ
jgi:hypothetical protein